MNTQKMHFKKEQSPKLVVNFMHLTCDSLVFHQIARMSITVLVKREYIKRFIFVNLD